jgi:uncharacterized membrane protein
MMTARHRLAAITLAGIVAGSFSGRFAPWQVSVLGGWCVAAAVFLLSVWIVILPADGAETRALATREDDSRFAADAVVLIACVASLAGVGFVLLKAAEYSGSSEALITAVGVLAIVMAWLCVHTVFTLRYAHLFFLESSGIEFNEDASPDYHDFAYLAFTIGMTYQVSDTNITNKTIRRAALRHGLVSFVFGTAVIAVMINVVAGFVK